MVTVPGFLLRRLYVKSSLRNTEAGFEFELRNSLGSGYSHRMLPLSVDGAEVPMESASFVLEGEETPFEAVSRARTFTLALNTSITIRVSGVTLDAGPRKIGMGFEVPGLGELRFDFTDVPADD